VLILSALITGVATGSMYGLLALGFHVTWAVSRTVNFAQGSSMMLGAVLLYGLTVTHSWPGAGAVVVALASAASMAWPSSAAWCARSWRGSPRRG